jgi:protein-tyrosine phosphatase
MTGTAMPEQPSRHIAFDAVLNFRDLGGYPTRDGRRVAWRRLFRSGDFLHMTEGDLRRLTVDIGITSVIDLRSSPEVTEHGIGLLARANIRYHNISFIAGGNREEDERLLQQLTSMGEFYLHLVRQGGFGGLILRALEIIAGAENHPLVFHCAMGKDRTGILAAVLLGILGVEDRHIIEDYALSTPYIEEFDRQLRSNPEIAGEIEKLPGYLFEATPESMSLFLSTLHREYGSVKGYLEAQGAGPDLFPRLEKALLV